MAYLSNLLVVSFLFATLTVSLNVICGSIGLFSVAHAAFFGVGAYTSAIILTQLGLPFLVSFPAAVVVTCIAGALISISTGRLKEDYLLIATLGFGEILQSLFRNLSHLTGGAGGISNIPSPAVFGMVVDSDLKYVLLAGFFLVLAAAFAWRVKNSPMGTVWCAIAEDDVLVTSIGRSPYSHRVVAFVTSAAIAGGCGALYASYMAYVSPDNFSLSQSILIFTMMIFGGLGSISGSILGAFLLILLPEGLRFIGIPSELAANIRQMLNGVILVLIMYLRPKGLVGS